MAGLRVAGIRATTGTKLKLAGIGAITTVSAGTKLRVSGMRAVSSTAGQRLSVAGISATTRSTPGTAFRLAGITAGLAPVSVNTIAAQGVEPYTLAAATATVSTGTASTWAWRQVSGPTVKLSLSNGDRTAQFTAPASVVGATIVLGVTATSETGQTSNEVLAEFDVYPHTSWYLEDGAWVPGIIGVVGSTTAVIPVTPTPVVKFRFGKISATAVPPAPVANAKFKLSRISATATPPTPVANAKFKVSRISAVSTAPAANTAMPTGPATSVNGNSMPLTWSNDFTTPAAVGSMRSVYSGMDYYDGFKDTSNQGVYDTDSVLSVSNSNLVANVHRGVPSAFAQSQGASNTSQPLSAAVLPDAYAPHTNGRYAIRYKTDATAPGWKFVMFFWPNSDNWNQGEIDWPESLDVGSAPRPANAVPGSGTFNADGSGPTSMVFVPPTAHYAPTDTTDYHIAVCEWDANGIYWFWDGALITSITDPADIPTNPMRVTLQFETTIGETVPASTPGGNIYIDWIAIWGAEQVATASAGYGASYGTSYGD